MARKFPHYVQLRLCFNITLFPGLRRVLETVGGARCRGGRERIAFHRVKGRPTDGDGLYFWPLAIITTWQKILIIGIKFNTSVAAERGVQLLGAANEDREQCGCVSFYQKIHYSSVAPFGLGSAILIDVASGGIIISVVSDIHVKFKLMGSACKV